MYAHTDLLAWQAAWTMHDEQISCSHCGVQQPSKYSNVDFVHSPACPRASNGQRPWEELMAMLIVPIPRAHAERHDIGSSMTSGAA